MKFLINHTPILLYGEAQSLQSIKKKYEIFTFYIIISLKFLHFSSYYNKY